MNEVIDLNDPRPKSLDIFLMDDYSTMLSETFLNIGDYCKHMPRRTNQRENSIKISRLPHSKLITPLDTIIEPDDDGFIARCPDLPLYGFGDDRIEAIEALKNEIESLYDDLMKNDNFTEDWLQIKEFLSKIIIPQ